MKWVFWGLVTGLVIGCASIPKANADPVSPNVASYAISNAAAVCATLDDYPTLDGVAAVAYGINGDGFTFHEAGQIIALSVESKCPRHLPLLQRFIDTYDPPKGMVA